MNNEQNIESGMAEGEGLKSEEVQSTANLSTAQAGEQPSAAEGLPQAQLSTEQKEASSPQQSLPEVRQKPLAAGRLHH